MAKDLNVKCAYCDKKETFTDLICAQNADWFILGWSINKNEPIMKCPKCAKKDIDSD